MLTQATSFPAEMQCITHTSQLLSLDAKVCAPQRPFPHLPAELVTKILSHTLTSTTQHNPTLYAALLVSRTFHAIAAPLLWASPRIGARVSSHAWKAFVHAVRRHRAYIHEIEDVWLVVGCEDDTPYVDRTSNKHDSSKRDSAVSLLDYGYRGAYTLPAALSHLLTQSTHLRTLRLHLHSDIPLGLPWPHFLATLVELEIRMRVTDAVMETILAGARYDGQVPCAPNLKTVVLHCTNVSNAAVGRLCAHAPKLERLTVVQVPLSRYAAVSTLNNNGNNTTTSNTNQTLSPALLPVLFKSHSKLRHLHITPLPHTLRSHLAHPPPTLTQITLTLSSDVTLSYITTTILPRLPHLGLLCLTGPPPPEPATLAVEAELLAVPTGVQQDGLRTLRVRGCELVRHGMHGLREVYGLGMPWAVDEFLAKWRDTWPGIRLDIAS
ncbi:hypothetical protein DFJ77DRAFT_513289 [Powellomyces hirtus]|nr:hypothetical protein DFJ77DRAFT_513289 [Powellomyces hirtus]